MTLQARTKYDRWVARRAWTATARMRELPRDLRPCAERLWNYGKGEYLLRLKPKASEQRNLIAACEPTPAHDVFCFAAGAHVSTVSKEVPELRWNLDAIGWDPKTVDSVRKLERRRSRKVTVAVIDTGCDLSHRAFNASVTRTEKAKAKAFLGMSDAPPGWQVAASPRTSGRSAPAERVRDDVGHGTHVAGIIGASRTGSFQASGVFPGVRILPIKVLDRCDCEERAGMSTGIGHASDVAAAVHWAVDQGVDVINLSLGSPQMTDPLKRAILAAEEADIVVVASAGNGTERLFPGDCPTVLAVGALRPPHEHGPRSHGSGSHAHPPAIPVWKGAEAEIWAPGVAVYSTGRGGEYTLMNGTSVAAPHVAAAAAIEKVKDPKAKARVVRNRLVSRASKRHGILTL